MSAPGKLPEQYFFQNGVFAGFVENVRIALPPRLGRLYKLNEMAEKGSKRKVPKIKTEYVEDFDHDYFYALEKLRQAVHTLAVGKWPIKGRLIDAHAVIVLTKDDFPPELQEDFEWIYRQLTKNPSKTKKALRNGRIVLEDTGALLETVPYMRIKTAVAVADRIYELTSRLGHFLESSPTSSLRGRAHANQRTRGSREQHR